MNLSLATRRLADQGVPDPARDARRLFEWAYAQGQKTPQAQTRETPNTHTLHLFEQALARRMRRVPVAQITGQRAFWRHEFEVTADVLDPRPDTETLIECALLRPFVRLLDLGTGSGCIPISLLAERPQARAVATDLSQAALEVAARNARTCGVAERLELVQSDWLAKVEGCFDLIVSNPPYIALDEMGALAPELSHEPRMALTDEGDGLGAYRAIAAQAPEHLRPGGYLMVEIGPTQAQAVRDLFARAGLDSLSTYPDLDGRDRVVTAQKPENRG